MSAVLSCSGLVSGYLNRPVLHGVSLDIPQQGVMALIGPNGHGKTTLLRTLSGFLTLRAGHISLNGTDINRASVHARVESGLIHVPQGDQLFTEMTVEENLLMGAYLCVDGAEVSNRLNEVFALFPKLKDRRNQMASGLSGGERRMVGIGRGLMADAKLLMLDEPSLGLAPLVIEQIYEALGHLRQSGMAFLVVEENPSRLLSFADSLCLMDAGHIVWRGTAEEAKSSGDILKTYLGGQ
ncbi:ABC transporter ATP-binding protein [Roseovarius aestuarii]|uniref:High-affinity branched-chain amino acid transport ATP-binding protein LivF n=1 Tax=Roseovarius aestuarii TaxID=475083 RepID=A0A1X7BY76_9RHOB|nr:ABC transporter ATP-binding protein [Roseovarius aestuarii]SMC14548.1 High-affinity branched-chain amino acid transport ATP-binding protein LivF [Roseovarius aestuarii]